MQMLLFEQFKDLFHCSLGGLWEIIKAFSETACFSMYLEFSQETHCFLIKGFPYKKV